MTGVLQMTGFLTFLQTEVAKVRVGGKRGLLVLPGVVGDRLVDTLHRLQQLGGKLCQGGGQKSVVKWRR